MYLALGTGRQGVAAAATQAHETQGKQAHAEHLAQETGKREVAATRNTRSKITKPARQIWAGKPKHLFCEATATSKMDLPTVQGCMSLSPIVVPTKKKRLEAGMNGITSRPKPSIGAGLRDTQRSP